MRTTCICRFHRASNFPQIQSYQSNAYARDLIDPNQRAQCNSVVRTSNYAFGCIRRIYGHSLSNSKRFRSARILDFNRIDDFIEGELLLSFYDPCEYEGVLFIHSAIITADLSVSIHVE